MNNVTAFITSWITDNYENVKSQLMRLGLQSNQIQRIQDKVSRPISANKALNSCPTEFALMVDDDIYIKSNTTETMITDLLKHFEDPNVMLSAASLAQVNEFDDNMTNPNSGIKDITDNMTTLNFVLIRKSSPVRFDERFYGSQVFDLSFGKDLGLLGCKAIMDCNHFVQHKQTNYALKSLSYHVLVSRNRHIYRNKYNPALADEVPSIEYLTHANETDIIHYIAKWDLQGLTIYLTSRYTADNIKPYIAHIQTIFNIYQPKPEEANDKKV